MTTCSAHCRRARMHRAAMQCQHGGGAAVSAAKASAAIANTSQTRKHATATEGGGLITLALTGDVMLGRAVDCAVGRHTGHQLDPYVHAARGGDALALVACLRKAQSALHSFFLYLYCRTLHEKCVASALGYIALAERARGALPRNEMARLGGAYPLAAVAREFEAADLAVVNVETALTTSNDWLPKGINYRAHPGNALVALHAIGVPPRGVATLANNHILDWGRQGLLDTLRSLDAAGAVRAGAGFDAADAAKPAEIRVRDTLVRVAALGSESSGVPPSWDEGIQGYDQYRDDLAVLWRATLERATGTLAALVMVPCRIWHLAVMRTSDTADVEWLRATIQRESKALAPGICVEARDDGNLHLCGWQG